VDAWFGSPQHVKNPLEQKHTKKKTNPRKLRKMKVTTFSNAYSRKASITTLDEVLQQIKNQGQNVLAVRSLHKTKNYSNAKKQLPLVIWAGEFTGKKTKDVKSLNGVLYFDIDDTKGITRKTLEAIPEVYALWTSVSGEGFGGLVRYEGDYKKAYKQLCKVWAINYGIHLDRSCSNVNRMNFISYDENLYINENAKTIFTEVAEVKEDIAATGTYAADLEDVIEIIMSAAEALTGAGYVKGNYHNYLLQLVSGAVMYGVAYDDFISNIESYVPLTKSGINKVSGLYQDWLDTFGTKTWAKTHSLYNNRIFKNSFGPSAVLINQRWTSDYADLQTHQAIKAAKNTGKSTLTKTWLEKFPTDATTFVFTYRRTLSAKLVADLGFSSYLDCSGDETFKQGGKYVVCIHSLYKIPPEVLENSVVVVDEIESTLKAITTDTNLKDKRTEIREGFEAMLSTAQGTLLLDADLSDGCFEYLQIVQPKLNLLINEYQPKKGQKVQVVTSLSEEKVFQDILHQSQLEGVVPYLCCSVKSTAEVLHNKMSKDGMLLSADTKANHNDFLANPNNYYPDYLITTPCFESGNSLENNHYNLIIGVYQGTHQSIEAFYQQMARVRSDVPIIIYCLEKGNENLIESKTEKLETLLDKARLATEGKAEVKSDAFTELCAHLQAKHSQQVHQPLQAMVEKAQEEGYSVNFVSLEGEIETQEFKVEKEQLKTAHIEDILTAEEADLELLKEKTELTQEEQASYHKQVILKFTDKFEINEEDVTRYLDGKTYETIKRCEYFTLERNPSEADAIQARYYFTDKDLWDKQVDLLSELNLDYYYDNPEDIDEDALNDLFESCKIHAAKIKALYGINVLKYKKRNTLLKAIFKLVGINLSLVRSRKAATRDQYFVLLEVDHYVRAILENRKAKSEKIQEMQKQRKQAEELRILEIEKQLAEEAKLIAEGKFDFSKNF
jgi:hypothetical protein